MSIKYDSKREPLAEIIKKATINATYVIPDLQRPYVWSPRQVTMLVDSLFRGWPFGSLDLAKKMDSRYFCTVNPKEGVMSKRFSEQFKQEAVQLVSAERPIRQVASYLGIGYSTLDKWVRAHRERTGQLVALTQEQKRIRELERQVAHLQEVNDILKKATVYFANPANR